MRHLTFALLLPSAIQSAGMKAILRKMPDINCAVVDLDAANWIEDVSRGHPSVLIADPLCCDIEWEVLKSASSFPVKLIALLSHQMPSDSIRWFDDTFSVYDSPDRIIEVIKRNLVQESEGERAKDLSPREKEVVVGIVKGLSNKEIAAEMNVSVNTIMTHRRNIASKLHIHTPAGLTIYAIVSNLVRLEDIKADMDDRK